MDVQVVLQDANGKAITDRSIGVLPTLVYEDNSDVSKKTLLKLLQDSRLQLDRGGKALVRFRVDDVSKNHQVNAHGHAVVVHGLRCVTVCATMMLQNQRFRLKVAPTAADPSLVRDIGWDVTTPVTVRSKRNKRPLPSEYTPIPSPAYVAPPSVSHSRTPAAGSTRDLSFFSGMCLPSFAFISPVN